MCRTAAVHVYIFMYLFDVHMFYTYYRACDMEAYEPVTLSDAPEPMKGVN